MLECFVSKLFEAHQIMSQIITIQVSNYLVMLLQLFYAHVLLVIKRIYGLRNICMFRRKINEVFLMPKGLSSSKGFKNK